jgi:hypothetical protein
MNHRWQQLQHTNNYFKVVMNQMGQDIDVMK